MVEVQAKWRRWHQVYISLTCFGKSGQLELVVLSRMQWFEWLEFSPNMLSGIGGKLYTLVGSLALVLLLMATALNVPLPRPALAEVPETLSTELRTRQQCIAEITEMIHVSSLKFCFIFLHGSFDSHYFLCQNCHF
ncbi:hypothetical protein CK203_099980 [Vitis vinifera]|uniref:Uncharacterized protein n=1 Tax=Vitis vinifera TaxID=29760 RepID=A0A438CIR7_VITVI|nr:hypothetical protein CK203_099980 [Vitis vinifera]